MSAGRVKRPALRNQEDWENYFRQPGSWDQASQATSCEYCDPDPKHKPDPGLGFHFQFLNSLSHQISDRLSQDGRLILHSQFYLGLNLGIFLETDYRGGFSGINLNSADEMLCPRVKSYQSDGPEDYSKQSSW